MSRYLSISRNLALGFGIFLPIIETIRRWKQLSDPAYFISWFDDYLLGGLLIFAALKARDKVNDRVYLAAAWGVATGAIFLSTLGQVRDLQLGKADPAPVSSGTVLAIKLFFLLLCVTGMIFCFDKKNKAQ